MADRRSRAATLVLSVLAAAVLSAAVQAQSAPPATADARPLVDTNPDLRALETFDTAWMLINRTHFDPTFNGVDWVAVRDELRPKAAAAKSVHDLRAVIRDMIGRLGQSHFALLPQEVVDAKPGEASVPDDDESDEPDDAVTTDDDGATERHDRDVRGDTSRRDEPASEETGGEGDVGFDVRLIDDQVIVTDVESGGPASKAGIGTGWILLAVNDLEVEEQLEAVKEELDPHLAGYQVWQMVGQWLDGPAGRSVSLRMLDDNDEMREVRVKRRPDPAKIVQFGNLPPIGVRLESRVLEPSGDGPTVGVIQFNMWIGPVVRWIDEAMETMRHADGIVVDLRGNPGGVGAMSMGVAGHFINEKIPLGVMKTRGTELKFLVNPRRVNIHNEPVRPFAGPVALLVDGQTASTSEVFAGGMQSLGRVRIFGERTLGAALPAAMDRLPNGDVLLHAFADFLTADGVSLEARGVIPDELVERTRTDLLAGRDAALEAAIDWIARETTVEAVGGAPRRAPSRP